ncbi:MAG: DNA-protecting protein DprA [Rhodocyclaceae bacterium]|jgi:DNA processing protein|nr:DNA-protecting protein DprA [Rhodocyclaceae bacterium]MBK6909105.1 DNA-protecting protein DprA [Rhodocyclaceae bacterium]
MADSGLAAWLRLTLIEGIGGESQRALLSAFGLPEAIFAASPATIEQAVGSVISRRLLAASASHADGLDAAIATTLAWAQQAGNAILTLADPAYPQALLESADPPTLLYVKGRVDLLNRPMLAMVGSRNATAQGERDAEAFARHLADAGLTIVSGLALGIDAAAHRGALGSAAGTVAIIGTGADRLYPARNADLGRQIAERGAIVSEFPLGTPAIASNFPRRNRIIAGLAKGTLVVEAAPRSGSLITARLASESGREVFAIPGSIHAPQSKGCHQLIRQGAKLVETANDVLEELRWEMTSKQTGDDAQSPANSNPCPQVGAGETAISQDPQHEQVLTALGHAPCTVEVLLQRTCLTAPELLAILLSMELGGKVKQHPGGLYQQLVGL